MTFDRIFWLGFITLWTFVVAALLVMISQEVRAEYHIGHPNENMFLHEQFYTNWNMPDNRGVSCCNRQDCAPVDRVEYKADGTIWMLRTSDQVWLKIPANKIEHNYNDAKGSPDGRSHMCSAGATVYCAVLGDGT